VRAFIADILASGLAPKTASGRLLGVRRFSAWLAAKGEIDTDSLIGLKQPKLDRKVVDALTDDELRDLIRACQGMWFQDRRDEALSISAPHRRRHAVVAYLGAYL
jgi:site-specific recombinase XerC